MKTNRVLRYTALLLLLAVFSQCLAYATKPLDLVVVRDKIAAIGEGQKCRVKLMDGSQAKGLIVSIHTDNFTLKTKGVEEPRRIDYAQITEVHKAGRMSDAKVAITIGAVTAGVVVGLTIWFVHVWLHG